MFVFVSISTKNPDCNLRLCLSHIFGRISLIRDDNVHKRNITSSSVAVNTKITVLYSELNKIFTADNL